MVTKPTVSISEIEFSSGQKFVFSSKEKIILVGSDNSGKSKSLREIMQICNEIDHEKNVVVRSLKINKSGNEHDLKHFLDRNASLKAGVYNYKSWSIHEGNLSSWSVANYLPYGLAAGFIKNINANDRLQICNQQSSISPGEQKSKPQHVLYDDSALMTKISDLFRAAFGQDLMFDYRGGKVLPIHVGLLPRDGLVDRVGDAYVAAVRTNPLLDQQGDGMKSYAGILLETLVLELDINLLDEPEAFLHPPQMRRLGETLASEVEGQLIVATHSSDIMRGFLEGTKGNVRVLRIRREGDRNLVSEAAADIIQGLWTRPELRYSNALEGVFHEQTIICEDDSDCRLFNAIADYLEAKDDRRWLDTAYVPTGGKSGVKNIAQVLRSIGVPIKAVFDIDFLSEENLVEETVKAFGGDWCDFSIPWSRLDAEVRKGVKAKSIPEIKEELIQLLETCSDENLPRGTFNEKMKQNSSWNLVKKLGKAAIPKGQAQFYYKDLKSRLQDIGIYLVEVGEVENFCPEIGRHGPKFVNKLLSEIDLGDEGLDNLRKFVSSVHFGPHAPLPGDASIDDDEPAGPKSSSG